MNFDDPLDFGPYQPQNILEGIFMYWVKNLTDGVHYVIEHRAGSNDNYAAVVSWSTICAYALYKSFYEKEGSLLSIGPFYFDFLLPSLDNFLKNNDEAITQIDDRNETGGPAQALFFLEEIIHSQVGHVDDDELQEQWEALQAQGDLHHASQEHRRHIENIVHKHGQSHHIPTQFDFEDLIERLHAQAIKDALTDTGPARRKKRGKNAGQPKTLKDAFGWSSVTEHLKHLLGEGNSPKQELTDKDKEFLLELAETCCTPLQKQYLRMHYIGGLSFREIAKKLGKDQSTVSESYRAAQKKVKKLLR
jgi:RNA polymerase sigma factor (sigma-70 family)